MVRNKVQFQKGLSLNEFLSHFGTDKQCRNILFNFRWPKEFKCPKCGNESYCKIKKRNLFLCNKCHTQTSVTAGSIFAATKLPLTTWFLAIYFMTQSKVSVSALSLSRTLGVSANTALLMKYKIQQVMKSRDDHKPLTLLAEIDNTTGVAKNEMELEVEEQLVKLLLLLLFPLTKKVILLLCASAK